MPNGTPSPVARILVMPPNSEPEWQPASFWHIVRMYADGFRTIAAHVDGREDADTAQAVAELFGRRYNVPVEFQASAK